MGIGSHCYCSGHLLFYKRQFRSNCSREVTTEEVAVEEATEEEATEEATEEEDTEEGTEEEATEE